MPLVPSDVRHRTAVSDTHSVDSHPVPPTRAASVYVASPKPCPCTVTLADPVPARFVRVAALTVARSTDHASVAVPARSPAVITSRRVLRAPSVVRHRTDVSDHHSVDSHPVPPSRPADV